MDDAVKKNVMVGVVVVCIIVAGVVLFMNRSKSSAPPKGELIWVKCTDPECAESFEVPRGEYDDFIANNYTPVDPKLYPCKKCSKNTCSQAIKCPKCGFVFLKSESASNTVQDKCPECEYSALEEKINSIKKK